MEVASNLKTIPDLLRVRAKAEPDRPTSNGLVVVE